MINIISELNQLKSELPPSVTLVAVSKLHDIQAIQEAYDAGQRIFAENYAQELDFKYKQLPADIRWHFIGHLQTNKVKQMAGWIDTVQSVDSIKLLTELNHCAGMYNRRITILLQVHIAQEEHKFGFSFDEINNLLNNKIQERFVNLKIAGLMGMATFTDDRERIRKEFASLHAFFLKMKNCHFENNENFKELSMGMSDDYKIAIQEGSTMVRIGSKIFGERKN
jgi:pyridoxal phosphate enzyme (YggS family)